jgi:hypothetical protein
LKEVEEQRDQALSDVAAVSEERNKYSQTVADLEAQVVSVIFYN